MQRNSFVLLASGLLLFCSVFFTLTAQPSVVAIDVNNDNKYDGHGVAWKAPGAPGNFVVTTLHLVAGRSNMNVQTSAGVGKANIVKVYTDADLALMEVQGLALQHIQADNAAVPPQSAQYWAFDNLSRKFDNSPVKMRGNKALGNLHVKLKKPQNLQKFTQNLCKPQYPSLQASVIKLKTPVRPGHSGSPIINANGQLVGLIDGGLVNIGIQNVFWSVPVKHFNTLWNQPPYQNNLGPCTSDTKLLYSGAKTVIEDDRRYIEIFSLGKAGQMKFEDIYYSMLVEDQEYVLDLLNEEAAEIQERVNERNKLAANVSTQEDQDELADISKQLERIGAPIMLEELFEENVEVYVDYTTGATIAFPVGYDITQMEKRDDGDEDQPPAGTNLIEFDGSGEWADLDGFIVVANKDNYYDVENVRYWYNNYLEEEYSVSELITEDADEFADFYNDSDSSFYDSFAEYIPDSTNAEQEDDEFSIISSVTIDDFQFLGIAFKADNLENLGRETRKRFYLMEICISLAGFQYN